MRYEYAYYGHIPTDEPGITARGNQMSNTHPLIDAIISKSHSVVFDKSIRYHIDLGIAGEWLCDVFYREDPRFSSNEPRHFEVTAILRAGQSFPEEIEEQLISELTYREIRFQASCAAGYEVIGKPDAKEFNVCLGI